MNLDNEKPIGEAEFSKLMRPLGPFERRPELAIGFSGGPDSTGLLVLATRWVKRRNGKIFALTVNHGLRADSLSDAKIAQNNIKALGVSGRILSWEGPKPTSGVQNAAREARYAVMSSWCYRRGILHLLLAHHEEDQAETLLHRLGRKTGADGLAGMPCIREAKDVRILRPCLSISRARLSGAAKNRGIRWIEDPSNKNRAYARVRLRNLLPSLEEERISAAALTGTARRLAGVRKLFEDQTGKSLADSAELNSLGYAKIHTKVLKELDPELVRRILERLLGTIGGHIYPIRRYLLDNLIGKLQKEELSFRRTLAGCLIQTEKDDIFIIREAARCENKEITSGVWVDWDRRFRIRVTRPNKHKVSKFIIQPLGDKLSRSFRKLVGHVDLIQVNSAVRKALPSIWDENGLVCVPHLGYRRAEVNPASVARVQVAFQPKRSATNASFPVV